MCAVEKSCCVRPLHSTFLAGKQSQSQNKACVLPFLLKSLSTRLVWGGGDQSIYGSIASTDRAHYYYYIQSTFFSRQSPLSLISTSDKIGGNQFGSRTENKLWLHWGVSVVNTHPRGGRPIGNPRFLLQQCWKLNKNISHLLSSQGSSTLERLTCGRRSALPSPSPASPLQVVVIIYISS